MYNVLRAAKVTRHIEAGNSTIPVMIRGSVDGRKNSAPGTASRIGRCPELNDSKANGRMEKMVDGRRISAETNRGLCRSRGTA